METGVVGGVLGGIAGEEVVDMIYGEEETHEQPKAEQMRYQPEEERAMDNLDIDTSRLPDVDGQKGGR